MSTNTGMALTASLSVIAAGVLGINALLFSPVHLITLPSHTAADTDASPRDGLIAELARMSKRLTSFNATPVSYKIAADKSVATARLYKEFAQQLAANQATTALAQSLGKARVTEGQLLQVNMPFEDGNDAQKVVASIKITHADYKEDRRKNADGPLFYKQCAQAIMQSVSAGGETTKDVNRLFDEEVIYACS